MRQLGTLLLATEADAQEARVYIASTDLLGLLAKDAGVHCKLIVAICERHLAGNLRRWLNETQAYELDEHFEELKSADDLFVDAMQQIANLACNTACKAAPLIEAGNVAEAEGIMAGVRQQFTAPHIQLVQHLVQLGRLRLELEDPESLAAKYPAGLPQHLSN